MRNTGIANIYSKIIFSVAAAEKSVDKVIEDFRTISEIIESKSKIVRFLKAPIYSTKDKLNLLKDLENKFGFSKSSMYFLEVIIQNNRSDYIEDIYRNILSMKMHKEGLTLGLLSTAHAMTAADIAKSKEILEQKLEKRFIIEHKYDSSIIGGLRLSFDNIMYDATVASAINKIRELV